MAASSGNEVNNTTPPEDSQDQDFSDSDESLGTMDISDQDISAKRLSLRDYQQELAEEALKGSNTVICAPTGSGKTRVATHIILDHLCKTDGRKKKVAFLARTVPLTMQQYKSLFKYLSPTYKITYITGDSKESMSLEAVIKEYDVVVMTPMILQNNVERTGFNLSKLTLLVLDECHHTRKEEPYNKLMLLYLRTKSSNTERPQVVGLTASFGIENGKTVKEATASILNVLSNLDAPNLSTVKKKISELEKLVPVPYEEFVILKERDADEAVQKIIDLIKNLENHIKENAKALNDNSVNDLVKKIPPNKKSQDYGQWAVQLKQAVKSVPIVDQNTETNLNVRSLLILSKYLVDYNVALESYDLVELSDIINYLEKCFVEFNFPGRRTLQEESFYQYFTDFKKSSRELEKQNPNLKMLLDTLLKQLDDKASDARCIIFVRTRALAENLTMWLNRQDALKAKNFKAKYFTGINASEDKGGMTSGSQEHTLQSFRDGKTNVLVATSVAEEGLDIPDCNLIIKYNHVGNEVTTVQTKGRARKLGGFSVLLAMENVMHRERGNQEKTILMKEAIKEISKMNSSEIVHYIDHSQQQRKQEADLEAKVASEKRAPQEKTFTMVCSHCRKVCVNNTNIRTIFNTHRISIDRELLNSDNVKIVTKEGPVRDTVEFLGLVYCQGKTDIGSFCGNKLGSTIKFNKLVYIALGINNFGFFIGTEQKLQHFKKWSKVPYSVEELSNEDELKYAECDGAGPIVMFENDSSE